MDGTETSDKTGYIGYNIDEINTLTEKIKTEYGNFETDISGLWTTLVSTLDLNWVGEDEQSYCLTLAKKLNELNVKSAAIASDACGIITGLGKAWMTFQSENKMKNSEQWGATSTGGADHVEILTRTITAQENLFVYNVHAISDSTDRGLVGDEGGTVCTNALNTFVTDVKTSADKYFKSISGGAAFFGKQKAQLSLFMGQMAGVISDVVTAVEDMKIGIKKLTTKNYAQQDTKARLKFALKAARLDSGSEFKDVRDNKWTDE